MDNKPCPCKDCTPADRFLGCHSVCPDYKTWTEERQQYLAKLQKIREQEDACFPNYTKNGKKRRKLYGNNKT